MRYNLANLLELAQADEYLKKLTKQNAIVEIKKVNPRRSLQQNKYLHLLLGIYALEIGSSIDEVKIDWKRYVAPTIFVYRKNGKAYLKSTTDLDTKQLSDSIEKLKKFAAENGIILPDANENEKLTYYENELEKNYKWL